MVCQLTVTSGSHLNAKGHDNVGKSGKENTNKIITVDHLRPHPQKKMMHYIWSLLMRKTRLSTALSLKDKTNVIKLAANVW